MSLLELKSIVKSFTPEKTIVNNVSLTVEQGEIICFLGPSGCGKTTLLRIIAGLEKLDNGTVFFDGKNIINVHPHQRGFGMMFQDFALFPHKNVFDNIAFGLRMRGDSKESIQKRVAEMLELVDLTQFSERNISLLSGGEQQRVALARSLAPDPQLLMLDEPLGALDRALRERLMIDVRDIIQRVGVTAIYVTHDQTEAFAISDKVAVMNEGCIEQIDTPQVMFNHPATPFVARFLGFRNLIMGKISEDGEVITKLGNFKIDTTPHVVGQEVTILIKPEVVSDVNYKSLNYIHGIISGLSFRGKFYQVWLQSHNERLMFEVPNLSGQRVGEEISLPLTDDQLSIIGS